jgi:hypothetical protein
MQGLVHSEIGIEELQLNRLIGANRNNGPRMDLIGPIRESRMKLDRDGIGFAVVVGSHVNRPGKR